MPIVPTAPSRAAPAPDRADPRRVERPEKAASGVAFGGRVGAGTVKRSLRLTGRFVRLDTSIADSHLMWSAMKITPKIRRTRSGEVGAQAPLLAGISRHLEA